MDYELDTLLIASNGYLGDPLDNIVAGLLPIEIIIEIPWNSTIETEGIDGGGKAYKVIIINIKYKDEIERRYFKIPVFMQMKVISSLEKALIEEFKWKCNFVSTEQTKEKIKIRTILT